MLSLMQIASTYLTLRNREIYLRFMAFCYAKKNVKRLSIFVKPDVLCYRLLIFFGETRDKRVSNPTAVEPSFLARLEYSCALL
jgi:hypothetical protein